MSNQTPWGQQYQPGQVPPPPQGPWSHTNPHDIPPHAQALVQPKKKMGTGTKIGIGVASVVGVLIVGSALSGSPNTPTTSTAVSETTEEVAADGGIFTDTTTASVKLGESVKVAQGDGTATVTVSNVHVRGDQMWATDGGTVYDVDVTFVCESGTFHVNPFYFEARSASGKTLSSAIGGELNSTDCAAGETVTGTVGFNVAPGDAISKVILEGTLFDRLADWSVS